MSDALVRETATATANGYTAARLKVNDAAQEGDTRNKLKVAREHSNNSMNQPLLGKPSDIPPDEHQESHPPIAIVGMGMRLPGGVDNADAFWKLLINGQDGRCIVPADRYNFEAFYSSTGKPGTTNTKYGYFLQDAELQHLDAGFFSMNMKELERVDPQQRLALEVVWECMENAGQVGWRDGKNTIGCYVGVFGEDWQDLACKDPQNFGQYRVTGYGDFAISNRISYEYNLKGPSMTLRTACSSSLTGLHEACMAIKQGQCHSAIVAGTSLIMSPTTTIAMAEQGVLSPTGSCKSFDAKADGYARGEAINAIYIKRLSDAVRDKDPIRAVIRSTAINCDGRTLGLAVPSSESHESMMRKAYADAGISDLSRTALVECHGTGTAIGDPLEATAVANVFGDKGLYIGSVKPNVGHSEGASGITSLIKIVLALEHEIIPPNINFSEPHPQIPFERAKLQVPLKPTPWPKDRDLRASVNSFGIGGANAHIVLDSAKSESKSVHFHSNGASAISQNHLLVFSARHSESLRRSIQNYQNYASAYPEALEDLAFTLGNRREQLEHRAFCVAKDGVLSDVSPFSRPRSRPSLHFVFTGQGAQWAGMGKELMRDFPVYLQCIRQLDCFLAELPDAPDWTIEEELTREEKSTRLHKSEFAQPLCTAIQLALTDLLNSFGVSPSSVVGHSSGEIAAAYASHAISAKSAIIIAYYRGKVTKMQTRPGGMMAVGMGQNEVVPFLIKGVVIACENSQQSVTLSGDLDKLTMVADAIKLKSPDILVRQLKVDMAYHSRHMEEIGHIYQERILKHVPSISPDVPFYSSVMGELLEGPNKLSHAYWRNNLECPVLFNSAIRAILADKSRSDLFLEIGPHSALAGPLRQIFKTLPGHKNLKYASTLIRTHNSTESILATLGNLFSYDVPLDFGAITPGRQVLTNLPAYAWNHDHKYWHETRVTRDWRLRQFPPHELLGSRTLEGTDLEPTWRNILSLENVPWLEDHKIIDDVVFPAAGYIGMVGEAVRQLAAAKDFTLRKLTIKTALVLQSATNTEVITSFRPMPLTTHLDSDWYEFSVASLNTSTWTVHCAGQVKAGSDQLPSIRDVTDLTRRISASKWYSVMKTLGLNYGPCFQGLQDITTGPRSGSATATILDSHREPEVLYQLHPTTIDPCLQLFTVGVSEGVGRRMTKLCVPTYIEHLYINHGEPEIRVQVFGHATNRGTIKGNALAVASGKVVFELKGGVFSPLANEGSSASELDPQTARLHWKPDINFVALHELIRSCESYKAELLKSEEMTLLCILETLERVSPLETSSNHLQKFRSWLAQTARRARSGGYELVKSARSLTEIKSEQRLRLLEDICKDLEGSRIEEVRNVVLRVLQNCEGVFTGKIEPLEVLLQEDGLTKTYDFHQKMWDVSGFFQLLGHSKPNLRILEVGAGTGGTSISALEGLTASGARLYSQYDYTDISAGFFIKAKERFKEFSNIHYAILDITKDPVSQGFEAQSYDLIIATNVLHATPSIGLTLQNVRRLLRPNGQLLLQELTPQYRVFNYIMGILPGWWLGEADGRPTEPFISPERWDRELKQSGFSGTDAVVYDHDVPYQLNATIVSHVSAQTNPSYKVNLIYEDEITDIVMQVETAFHQRGFHVHLSTMDEGPLPECDVVSLIDLGSPMFDNISERKLKAFQRYIGDFKSNILWITRLVQTGCQDPRYSQLLGVARTVRSELLTRFATLELDVVDSNAFSAIVNVFSHIQKRPTDQRIEFDYEYAFIDGVVQIPRCHWMSVPRQLETILQEQDPLKLEIGNHGLLQSLRWVHDKPRKLRGDDVEIEPHAIGLNFKDILVCMGVVEGTKEGLGLEGAGIVRGIGPDVQGLNAGDRVLIFEHGCLSTSMILPENLVAKIPDDLSFEEAATMPCVYSTVIYSLLTLGRLEKGQTVLIHSACGGVGLAAIQVCRMIGAEIFATVGSEQKVQHLIDNEGIARERIFNSRNSSFYSDIMRVTSGRGVDVVLNSLSGELLHVSWQCVADFGKMLEIGKRDFIGSGKLSMNAFENNRAFYGIDIAQIAVEKPDICQHLMGQFMDLYKSGAIGPIKPMTLFSATQVTDAFRYMQRGQHIGKIVITMPEKASDVEATAVRRNLELRADKSYLLVGGLGGLGRAISIWLVEHGARHLIFISRTAGESPEHQEFFKDLEEQECSVQVFCGSATNIEHVKQAVANAKYPLAGVLHMSMVLRDQNLLQFTHEAWTTAIEPKVKVAWNLHEALADSPLDFFLLFSSLSGIVGYWGQANYAAANAFLDSFAQYRHSLNLPASVVDIGAVGFAGYVSENPEVLQQMQAASNYVLSEQEFFDGLHLAITSPRSPPASAAGYMNPSQLIIGLASTKSLSDPSNYTIWARDARMALYKNLESASAATSATESDELKQFLVEVSSDPSILNDKAKIEFLAVEIGKRMYEFMLKPEEDIDVKVSLTDMGVDSLMAIEFRNWFRSGLGLEMSVLEIMNAGSIEGLGVAAAEKLKVKFEDEMGSQKHTAEKYLLMKAP